MQQVTAAAHTSTDGTKKHRGKKNPKCISDSTVPSHTSWTSLNLVALHMHIFRLMSFAVPEQCKIHTHDYKWLVSFSSYTDFINFRLPEIHCVHCIAYGRLSSNNVVSWPATTTSYERPRSSVKAINSLCWASWTRAPAAWMALN